MCYLKFQIIWLLLLLYSNPVIISLKSEPKNYGYDSNTTFNVDASFKIFNISKNNKTLPKFPITLYNDFIKSHLTESFSFKQKKKDTQFLYKLLECIDTDINCAYHLGNLYFQGLVVPKIVSPYDSGKNLTRALGLWQYAASEGNANAQYQMALVYSTMYNAPSFLMNPQDVWNDVHSQMFMKTVPKQLKCWKSYHDKIESLIQNLSPLEIHRFVLSMKILDFQGEPQKLHEYESKLVEQFVKHYEQIKQQSSDNFVSTLCKAKSSLRCIFSSHHLNEHHFQRNVALTKTFPLHKRDGLAVLYMYLAAQGNHIGAQITLGYFHTHGLHTPQRCHAAAAYYLRVARDVVKISSHGIPQSSSNIRVSLLGLETVYDMEKHKILSVTRDLKSHYLDLQFHVARTGDPRSQTAVGKLHLFGIEHLPQNFKKAFHYFSLAAQSDYKEAISYLGYLYALGLGTERNLDMAFKLFSYVISSSDNNLAHNGLGYIYFKGTSKIQQDYSKAFHHFNISALNGFPDAQYNLGSMYLSGVGVNQSFTKGFHLLSLAMEQGHSVATYMMGIVHLNGIGTVRDCSLATKLFRRVALKHSWVVKRLQKVSIFLRRNRKEEAAFLFWSLSETGHEASQTDFATLLDGGGMFTLVGDRATISKPLAFLHSIMSSIPVLKRCFFKPTSLFSLDRYPSISVNRAFAQRYWELAAAQHSLQGYCRLGDYAYNGWGVKPLDENLIDLTTFRIVTGIDLSDDLPKKDMFLDNNGVPLSDWAQPRIMFPSSHSRQSLPNYQAAFRFYEAAVTFDPSLQPIGLNYVPQALFLLARLYQLGLGTPRSLYMAARQLQRLIQMNTSASAIVGKVCIFLLRLHSIVLYFREKTLLGVIHEDKRFLIIFINILGLCVAFLCQFFLKEHH